MLRCMVVACGVVLLAGCGDDDGVGPGNGGPTAHTLHILEGHDQVGSVGNALPVALLVRAVDTQGVPVEGVTISWQVTAGGGSVSASQTVTNEGGRAETVWTLGGAEGEQTVTASAPGAQTVTFTSDAVVTELCGTSNAHTTLVDVGIPYTVCADGLIVLGQIAVNPGVTVRVEAGGAIHVEGNGVLRAVGTAASPVRFLGTQEQPGHWEGIQFRSGHASNRLERAEVAHGGVITGVGSGTNILLDDGAFVALERVTIRDSEQYGIHVRGLGSIRAFSANSFSGNAEGALFINAQDLRWLDESSTYGEDAVINVGGGNVTTMGAWAATDAPLLVHGVIRVQAPITVRPGARFRMTQDAGIEVIGAGSFNASGSAASPIRFLGDQAEPGHWHGIAFHTDASSNVLNHFEIAHGGLPAAVSDSGGNVYIHTGGARATVTNGLIRRSLHYGIYVAAGGVLDASDNTFEENGSGDVFEG